MLLVQAFTLLLQSSHAQSRINSLVLASGRDNAEELHKLKTQKGGVVVRATPEMARIHAHAIAQLHAARPFAAFFADEAKLILDWKEFRPDMPIVAQLLPTEQRPPVVALTATLRSADQPRLFAKLGMNNPAVIRLPVVSTRPIDHVVVRVPNGPPTDPKPEYGKIILDDVAIRAVVEAGKALIFVQAKGDAHLLARQLSAGGIAATGITKDASIPKRTRAFQQLQAGTLKAVVATDVAAYGIDYDVDNVIQCGLAENIDALFQKAGRAGRRPDVIPLNILLVATTDFRTLGTRLKDLTDADFREAASEFADVFR